MAIPSRAPGVAYGPLPRAAGVASALGFPPRLIVIHDTSNTASAAAEASYAATRTDARANWTSAHFYVDGGGPLGSTPLGVQAWAAYSYANQHGWHIEMCGMNAGAANAVPANTVSKTAVLVRQLCQLAGIPMVKLSPAQVAAGQSGICGHYDITVGLGVGDHDDPGPSFNWGSFIAAVNSSHSEGSPMADTDVPGTFHAAKNGDNWGNSAITGAQPAYYEGGDGKVYQTNNVLHQKLDALLAKVTSLSVAGIDTAALGASIAAAVIAHHDGLTDADLPTIESAVRTVLHGA